MTNWLKIDYIRLHFKHPIEPKYFPSGLSEIQPSQNALFLAEIWQKYKSNLIFKNTFYSFFDTQFNPYIANLTYLKYSPTRKAYFRLKCENWLDIDYIGLYFSLIKHSIEPKYCPSGLPKIQPCQNDLFLADIWSQIRFFKTIFYFIFTLNLTKLMPIWLTWNSALPDWPILG